MLVRCASLITDSLSVPTPTPLPSLPTAASRLSSTLSNLKASRAAHQAAFDKHTAEQETNRAKQAELRDLVVRAETKREFFAELKEWVETVAVFLEEKVLFTWPLMWFGLGD